MSVQRWDFVSFDPIVGPHMRPADGAHTMAEWVRYADHERALAEERATALMDARCGDSASTVCACYHRGKADAEQPPWMAMFGAAAQPRTLSPDDPEPSVGSVVLDFNGDAWQRTGGKWFCAGMLACEWRQLFVSAPLRLIHDGGNSGSRTTDPAYRDGSTSGGDA